MKCSLDKLLYNVYVFIHVSQSNNIYYIFQFYFQSGITGGGNGFIYTVLIGT
jgi:hypothetical protein